MTVSPDRQSLPYRPCVGVMLISAENLVFVGHRAGVGVEATHEWQMPQGGIDEGEDPRAAAERELFEETNIRSIRFVAEAPDWYSYDLPPELVGRGWTQRYRGQTQKWFAYRFEGEDREIDIRRPGGGAYKPEFEGWRWEEMERLPSLIVPFKRAVYEQVVAAFRHLVA